MYLEDFQVGQKFHLEAIRFTEEDVLKFAQQYDPQPIHIDPVFARHSSFNGIIASGFHTLCVIWNQWIKADKYGQEIIGGMGLEDLKWTAPVRANDLLSTEVEVVEILHTSKQGRGVLSLRFEVQNQRAESVLSMKVRAMVKSRRGEA